MNKHMDRDTMSRVSCGKAAIEGYRRERRAQVWRVIGLVLLGAAVVAFDRKKALWQAEALESVSMQRPPGSMQREWLQEEADKLRRQAEEG